jgi:hypothetical protein
MNANGSWLSRRTFQEWLLLVVAIALVVLALRPLMDEGRGARLAIIGAPATVLRSDASQPRRWVVRMLFRNQGDRPATDARLRVLVGSLRDPSKLTLADDIRLANDVDPGTDVVRPLLFRGPPPPAAATPAPAPANGNAAANANAAAATAVAAAAEAPQPVNFVIVVQADYQAGGWFGGAAQRRWYFTYAGGSAAAVQAGRALRDQIEARADETLANSNP